MVHGACEGLGATTLLKDLGVAGVKARMHLDATAAKGIIERRGFNKVRHIETDVLRLQEQEARRILPLTKVAGAESIADLMTKNLSAGVIQGHLTKIKLRYAEGRSAIAQQLHSFSGADRCGLSGK